MSLAKTEKIGLGDFVYVSRSDGKKFLNYPCELIISLFKYI